MATQLKHTDFTPQPAPRPNIRVVFSAGPAAFAMREKLATVPEAEQTLDELTTIDTTGISLTMTSLLVEADQAEAAYNDYYRTVYEPVNVRYFAAQGTDAEAAIKAEREVINDHFDQLVTICSDAQSRVVCHPITTAADMRIKLAFIAKHQMGDGMDWTKQLLADAERMAAIQADANNIAVPFMSSRHPADVAPPLTFDPSAPMPDLLDQRTAVAAWMDGNHTTEAEESEYCDAINGIENIIISRTAATPADTVAKLIVLVQACAENADVLDTDAIRTLVDARRHFGLGYVCDLMLAQIGAEPVLVPAPIAEADAAWARATVEWQAVRQDLTTKGLSDEQVNVLADREMQAFCNLAELPLRTIADVMTKLQAMIDLFGHVPPDPLNGLIAEMMQLSSASLQGDDRAIRDAFAARSREFSENLGRDLTHEEETAYFARLDASEHIIGETPARTIEGVLAKLRITFMHQNGSAWADRAILDPSHPEFVSGLAEADMYTRMMWSAIEDLARIGGVNLSEQGK